MTRDKFVLQMNGLPSMFHCLGRNTVSERQGIYTAAASLINPFFQKHRIFVCGKGLVRGNYNRFSQAFDLSCLRGAPLEVLVLA